jgi:glycosyltransferase involved in cell wall biosynthesis
MRLLFVSAELALTRGTGGIGSYVDTVTRTLAARGHDVHVLSCAPDAEVTDGEVAGVHMHTRARRGQRGGRGEQTRTRLALAAANARYARELGPFDAIEVPDWQAEGLLLALCRRPVVAHLHTPHVVLEEFNQYGKNRDTSSSDLLERTAVRRARMITCPSRLLIEHLHARAWLGDRSVEVIRYPVDCERFTSLVPAGEAPPVVAVVGRVERRKSPERVVEALAVLQQRGVRASARFVGRSAGTRDGRPYAGWLREHAERLGVDVTFDDELMWQELPSVYGATRLTCVPSDFESFSMAAVEAMASGRPVLLSANVGASEILSEDPAGQVVEMSAHELADAMAPFLSDPSLATAVGRTNRELVELQCGPERVAARREALYQRVAGSR